MRYFPDFIETELKEPWDDPIVLIPVKVFFDFWVQSEDIMSVDITKIITTDTQKELPLDFFFKETLRILEDEIHDTMDYQVCKTIANTWMRKKVIEDMDKAKLKGEYDE